MKCPFCSHETNTRPRLVTHLAAMHLPMWNGTTTAHCFCGVSVTTGKFRHNSDRAYAHFQHCQDFKNRVVLQQLQSL